MAKNSVASMTGFARKNVEGEFGSMTLELRSVNHRFLELFFKLPEGLRELEFKLRDRMSKRITRGKVDCFIKLQEAKTLGKSLKINEALVLSMKDSHSKINELIGGTESLSALSLLQMPGILEASELDFAILEKEVMRLLDASIDELEEVRQREGLSLKACIEERLCQIEQELATIKVHIPLHLQSQREKIQSKLVDLAVEYDPARFEQEMVLLIQKLDVSEEIDRLTLHTQEVRRILNQGGVAGRRLDFLMQEMNREANTIGSKMTQQVITHACVELKVAIEQMREQIQNIE